MAESAAVDRGGPTSCQARGNPQEQTPERSVLGLEHVVEPVRQRPDSRRAGGVGCLRVHLGEYKGHGSTIHLDNADQLFPEPARPRLHGDKHARRGLAEARAVAYRCTWWF